MKETKPEMRSFHGGATRNTDKGKLDYEGFLSPLALKAYCEYLDRHRVQADGRLRDSDNWQKGIPVDVYMKSMFRHFMDVWTIHRGSPVFDDGHCIEISEALCSMLFNAMGYLHELEIDRGVEPTKHELPSVDEIDEHLGNIGFPSVSHEPAPCNGEEFIECWDGRRCHSDAPGDCWKCRFRKVAGGTQ